MIAVSNMIPKTEHEITADWFPDVTGIPIRNRNSFQILPNPNAHIGNLSTITRTAFVDTVTKTDRHFIVKRLPEHGGSDPVQIMLLETIISENMDGREVFFYSTLKSLLEAKIPALSESFVRSYASLKNDSGSVIILDDLSIQGYKMPTFKEGLNEKELTTAVTFLARFHIAGELLQAEHHGEISAVFPALNSWHVPPLQRLSETPVVTLFDRFPSLLWFPKGLDFVSKHVLVQGHGNEQVLQGVKLYAERILHWLIDFGSRYSTVIHDDLWPHNCLCREDGGFKVVDWQLLGVGDPTYDLAFLLLTSLPLEKLDMTTVTTEVRKYHHLKEKLYQEKSLSLNRTEEEFVKFFLTYGLAYGFVNLTMSADSLFADETYREKLSTIYGFLITNEIPQFILQSVREM